MFAKGSAGSFAYYESREWDTIHIYKRLQDIQIFPQLSMKGIKRTGNIINLYNNL